MSRKGFNLLIALARLNQANAGRRDNVLFFPAGVSSLQLIGRECLKSQLPFVAIMNIAINLNGAIHPR
jgi:hypothetical protein